MNIQDILVKTKEISSLAGFELCSLAGFDLDSKNSDESYFCLTSIKNDFLIELSFDSEESEYSMRLNRPFYGFSDVIFVNDLNQVESKLKNFFNKIDSLILEDSRLKTLTKKDCELFLQIGSYDGISSGVIEYQGQLYYIQSITDPYSNEKSKKDSQDHVWRNFYVFSLDKNELEKIVMISLDWIRNVNLTCLCKNWSSMKLKTGTEEDEQKYFNGKYLYKHEPKTKPVMKLTLYYK